MTTLPATSLDDLEAEMIAFARETNREFRDFYGMNCFTREAGRQLQRAMLPQYARHPQNHLHVAAMARAGFDDADEILRELGNEYFNRHELPPTALQLAGSAARCPATASPRSKRSTREASTRGFPSSR